VCVVTAAVYSSSADATVAPPTGTPDMSGMVLQADDLAPGSQLLVERYLPVKEPTAGEFIRAFLTMTPPRSLRVFESGATLMKTVDAAVSEFETQRTQMGSREARSQFLETFVRYFNKGFGRRVLRLRDIRIGVPAPVGVGDAAVEMAAHFRVRGLPRVSIDVILFRVDRVVGATVVIAFTKLVRADDIALARKASDRVRAALDAMAQPATP
jgi:hypothetical protein